MYPRIIFILLYSNLLTDIKLRIRIFIMSRLRRIAILFFLVIVIASCTKTEKTEENPIIREVNPVKAVNSYSFVNSIGVNTHFGFLYTNYYHKWDEVVYPRLKESGIKHIRDGNGYCAIAEDHYKMIGETGVKLLLNIYREKPEEFMPRVKTLLPMLSGIEAVNEGDFTLDTAKRDSIWVPELKRLQQELWEAIKGDPQTSHLPVVAGSFANIRGNPIKVGDLSQWLDYGNIHAYPGADKHPAENWGWDLKEKGIINNAQIICGSKPIITSETGYHNGMIHSYHYGVPEEVDAIYSLHVLFEYFNAGVVRTYLYEFIDQRIDSSNTDIEKHFGMIRVDGTPKPLFYAIRNLITLLNDEETSFHAQSLEYEISCDSLPKGELIKQTLLQKSDGCWWIAIYRTAPIYDLPSWSEVDCDPVEVKINLDRRAKKIEVYRPNNSQFAQAGFSNSHEFTFGLDERLVLVRIDR